MIPDPEAAAGLPVQPEDTLTLPVVAEAETETMQPVPETEVLPALPAVPFPGSSDVGLMGPAALDDGPCRCGNCGTVPEPGKGALLSCAPGVVSRMWQVRVRNGQWEDIPAVLDQAHARVHLPAVTGLRQIFRDIDGGLHLIAAVLNGHPDWRDDPELAVGLHNAAADLAEELAAMRQRAAEREADLRHLHEAEGQVAA